MSGRNSKRAIRLFLITTALALASAAWSSQFSTSGHLDPYFQRYAGRWMPDHDWRWLKAQCYQESLLDPNAVSHAGAVGLCQFMPAAWAEFQERFRTRAKRTVSQASIRAAAWYMHRMERIWAGRDRTPAERLPIAQASYNCGPGCVIRAQERCEDARLFCGISPCLPQEAQEYPVRIARWFGLLVAP